MSFITEKLLKLIIKVKIMWIKTIFFILTDIPI